MWIVSVIAVGIIAGCVWIRKPEKRGARHVIATQLRQTTDKTEHALMLILGEPFRRHSLEDGMISLVYCRGNPQMSRIQHVRDGRWHEVPAMTVASFKRVDGVTHVRIEMFVPEPITITRFAAPIFTAYAKHELEHVADKLALLDSQWVQEGGPQRNGAPSHARTRADDYAMLELKPGSTWLEVQSAFRTISMQFHPDRMVGLPPHLIELGSKRFKEASAAYQRLRGQFGTQI